MDWRLYDNALGRFHAVDKFAELAPSITPYRFGFNNPIYWSDAAGLFESREAAQAYYDEHVGYGEIGQNEDGIWYIDIGVGAIKANSNGGVYIISPYGIDIHIESGSQGGGGGSSSGASAQSSYGGHDSSAGNGMSGSGGSGGAGGTSGGGRPTATPVDWQKINTGIGAFGVGNGVKTGLIEYAGKTTELSKGTTNYLKFFKGAGVAGGMVSSTISISNAYNYYNNGGENSAVLIKTTLDVIMTGVGFLGPIGLGVSTAYFILDYATDGFGGYGNTN